MIQFIEQWLLSKKNSTIATEETIAVCEKVNDQDLKSLFNKVSIYLEHLNKSFEKAKESQDINKLRGTLLLIKSIQATSLLDDIKKLQASIQLCQESDYMRQGALVLANATSIQMVPSAPNFLTHEIKKDHDYYKK